MVQRIEEEVEAGDRAEQEAQQKAAVGEAADTAAAYEAEDALAENETRYERPDADGDLSVFFVLNPDGRSVGGHLRGRFR